jgi:hypothetical protein
MRDRRLHVPVLLTAVPLGLCGCAGTDAAPDASPASAAVSSSSDSSAGSAAASTPAGQRIEVTVAGGRVSGDTGRAPVAAGDAVTLVVSGNVADDIHLHGYDLTAPLVCGAPAELAFDAMLPGVFEVELHEAWVASACSSASDPLRGPEWPRRPLPAPILLPRE